MITNTEVIYKDISIDGTVNGYYEQNTSKIGASKRDQVLAGGSYNTISGDFSSINGGYLNKNSGAYSVVAGGYCNNLFGDFSTIAGGAGNYSCSNFSFIGGGYKNCSLALNSYIGGGYCSIVLPGHDGAAIVADGTERVHMTRGAHTLTMDFTNGIYMYGKIFHENQDVTSNLKDLGGVIRPTIRFIPGAISGMFV